MSVVSLKSILGDRVRLDEEHRSGCVADECDRCLRWLCVTCREENTADKGTDCVTCTRLKRWSVFADSIAIPARFEWSAFAATDLSKRCTARAIRAAKNASHASLLAFTGPTGCGKTSLAIATLRLRSVAEFAKPKPMSMRFMSAFAVANARSQHALGAGEAPLVELAMRADILLLDDVGSEADRYRDTIAEIVFGRHDAGLSIWFTTWLSRPELAKRYGGGAARRLLEGAIEVNCEASK